MNTYKSISVDRWNETRITSSDFQAGDLDHATIQAVNNEWDDVDAELGTMSDIKAAIWGEVIDFDNCRLLQMDEGTELLIVKIS